MRGVPADLDLSALDGASLENVCIGRYQFWFHFSSDACISVEGRWMILDASGAVVDRNERDDDWATRPPFQLHRLLTEKVTRSEVSAPDWFALTFANGLTLRVYDDSDQFESFSIGGVYV